MQLATAKSWLLRLRPLVPVATAALLCYQLSHIGWSEIWNAVPTSPLFYLIFFVAYWVPPVTDTVLYRRLWKFPLGEGFRAMVVKRVYNQDVMDYSGDVSLLVWAKRRLPLSALQIARTIKDNSLVSALCGHVVALVMPILCYVVGQSVARRPYGEVEAIGALAGPAVAAVLVVAVLLLRRFLFSVSDRDLFAAAGINFTRLALANTLLFLQWTVVMPEQPWYAWCVLLTLMNLASRLPSAMASQLIFVSAGVEASQQLGLPQAAAAGMLLVTGVFEKLLNLTLFGICSLMAPLPRPAVESCATESTSLNPEAA